MGAEGVSAEPVRSPTYVRFLGHVADIRNVRNPGLSLIVTPAPYVVHWCDMHLMQIQSLRF